MIDFMKTEFVKDYNSSQYFGKRSYPSFLISSKMQNDKFTFIITITIIVTIIIIRVFS